MPSEKVTLMIDARNKAKRVLGKLKRQVKGFADDARGRFGRVREAATRVRSTIFSWQSAVAAAGAAFSAARIGQKLFQWGAQAKETANRFRTVFGPSVDQVNDFLDEFATKAGLSRVEAQDLAASAGGLAQGFGFAKGEAADLSERILKLGGDIASFQQVPARRAIEAITTAMAGEREALKRLDILIRQADVNQKALAMTGKETAEALTQQEEALATLNLIYERAGVQVGDLNRTQDSAANRAKQLGAQWRNLRNAIGEAMIPTFRELLNVTREQTGEFDSLSERVKQQAPVIKAWARVAFESLQLVGQTATTIIRSAVNVGQTIGDLIVITFTEFAGRVMQLMNTVVRAGNSLIEGLNALPGVNIDFRFAELPAQEFLERSQNQFQALKGDVQDTVDTVSNLAGSWQDVRRASEQAARAQVRATRAGDRGPGPNAGGRRAGGRGGAGAPSRDEAIHVGGGVQMPLAAQGQGLPAGAKVQINPPKQLLDSLQEARRGGMGLASVLQNSLVPAFQTLISGSTSVASSFEAMMQRMISSLSRSLTRKGGPLGGLFSFLPGPLGGVATSLAGSLLTGLGSELFGGDDAIKNPVKEGVKEGLEEQDDGELTLIIEGGLLDTSNPDQMEQFRRALEDVTGRDVIVQGG